MKRWGVQRGEELLEATAASLAGSRFWISACVGMTRHGACRGAKPLCVNNMSPKSGGTKGVDLLLPRGNVACARHPDRVRSEEDRCRGVATSARSS
jgi:hypothetical protein